jgi:phytoene dehydrogenase-like protein
MRKPATAVVVVGGGLSGLAAAAHLARAGVPTIVFDEAGEFGGRAKTERRNGFHLNDGSHRLYAEGPAVKALRGLGIEIDGAPRGPNGGIAVWRGRKYTLPVGFCSLLMTGLFDACAKQEIARLMTSLRRIELEPLERVSIDELVRAHLHDPHVIQVVLALVRYATYSDDLDRLSASAALDQMRLSVTGAVLHVHHGWGTLITSGSTGGRLDCAEIVRGCRVTAVEVADGHARGVRLEEYRRFLPTVVVSHALVTAEAGGFSGRHTGRIPGLANVFLAGDWVGPEGQLADASVASGIEAARLVAWSLSFETGHDGTH